MSVRFTERLIGEGIDPSIGVVGDAHDNALAESINGLYKTELIKPRRPWRNAAQVSAETAGYIDWFNNKRLYEYCGELCGRFVHSPGGPAADTYTRFRVIQTRTVQAANRDARSPTRRPGVWHEHERPRLLSLIIWEFSARVCGGEPRQAGCHPGARAGGAG